MSYCFILSSTVPLKYSLFCNSNYYKYISIVFRRFIGFWVNKTSTILLKCAGIYFTREDLLFKPYLD